MVNIINKQDCCGCGACVQKCPKQCITLYEDNEGFLYPQVDTTTCIDCGLCEKVCPFLKPYDKREPVQTLAAINKNEEIRMQSSSGGIFTLLAERIIIEGGVVFGARFDEEWQVTLDYTETIEGLAAFRGSKYVQARTGDTYKQCEAFLKEGRKVLYSGTPCQVAGLKHFLRREYDNLLAIDFVCHGVPSPKVWRMYLDEVVGVVNARGVSMRDKREGWKRFNFVLDYNKDNQSYTLSSFFGNNDYMKAFLRNLILRPSCYDCKAKECRSNSDITIADYWGIQKVRPEMDDDKGTGLVLIHNEKGKNTLDFNQLKIEETTFEEGYRHNSAIYRSVKPWYRREHFLKHLDRTDSVIALIRKSLKPPFKVRFNLKVRSWLSIPKRLIFKYIRLYSGGGKNDISQQTFTERIVLPEIQNIKVSSVTFRSKTNSWKQYQIRITLR